MEDLITLVQFFQKTKFRSGSLLDILMEPETQMRQLFDALATGNIKSDEDALQVLSVFNKSATALATVKSKLKDRLNDALLLVEFNDTETNSRQKAYLECVKKWAAINVLLSRNYREMGLQRLEQLLRLTRRFEFTDMTIEILYMLRLQTGLIYGREHEYHEYDELLRQYQDLRSKEDLAETLYANLMIDFVHCKSDKREIAEKASGYFTQVEDCLKDHQSFRLHIFGRLLQVAIYDNQNHHTQVVALCGDAIQFFESKPYKSTSALQVFYYSQLVGYLNLRQFDHCRAVAIQYQGMFPLGSYNWYRWQELYFMAEIHASEYESALQIWLSVTERPEYQELPPTIAEFWKIYEAYLLLIMRCGLLQERKDGRRFKIGKIWNEIRVSSRDKSGMNIPILIVQFLLYLAEGDYGQCIDREESLAKYRTRYLRTENAARSHYFFRMLELIPRLNFDAINIQAQSAPLFEKMTSISRESINQNFEVEVVPYETLWSLVIKLLQKGNLSLLTGSRPIRISA